LTSLFETLLLPKILPSEDEYDFAEEDEWPESWAFTFLT
jgi:hypothetical protein